MTQTSFIADCEIIKENYSNIKLQWLLRLNFQYKTEIAFPAYIQFKNHTGH